MDLIDKMEVLAALMPEAADCKLIGEAGNCIFDQAEIIATLTASNEALKVERDSLKQLLGVAACPDCKGDGAYYDNHGEVTQCRWCDEVKQHGVKPLDLSDS